MNYLPEGFETLQAPKSYINLSKLPEGEFKYRIVQRPIAGWIDWLDKKPCRYRPDEKPAKSFDPEKPMKAFWSCYVWDYAQEGLFIMEVSQMGVIKALTDLGRNEDWGDFTDYDIKIKKEGSGKETKYSVMPCPHKPLGKHIEMAIAERPVNLDALYEGGDPWNDKPVNVAHTVLRKQVVETKDEELEGIDALKETLFKEGLDLTYLDEFIEKIAKKKGQTSSQVIESALLPPLTPKFKELYLVHVMGHLKKVA